MVYITRYTLVKPLLCITSLLELCVELVARPYYRRPPSRGTGARRRLDGKAVAGPSSNLGGTAATARFATSYVNLYVPAPQPRTPGRSQQYAGFTTK